MSRIPVPIEIVEHVLTFLEDLDTRTLRAASLVHPHLTPRCQRRMFRSVRVNGARWPRLVHLLADPMHAHLGPQIRNLTVYDFRPPTQSAQKSQKTQKTLHTPSPLGHPDGGVQAAHLTPAMVPNVRTLMCRFNVRLKASFLVQFPALDTLVVGTDCCGPLRQYLPLHPDHIHHMERYSSDSSHNTRLQRLHVTRPYQGQDDLLDWVMGTGSANTLTSVRLFFSPDDHPQAIARAIKLLAQAESLEHLLLDMSDMGSTFELPDISECVLPAPARLCIKARANERTVPIVLGLLKASFTSLAYLAVWLVSPSGRPQLGRALHLPDTYDAWAVSPAAAAQLQRVKVVLEDCRIGPADVSAFCRLFRVHDLPGVMDVSHVSRERIALELADFV